MEALESASLRPGRSRFHAANGKTSVLLDMSNFLASSLDLEHILNGSLSRVLEHFGFQGGRIYLMDKKGAHLKLAAHSGIEPRGLETVGIREGFSGKAARTRSFLAGRVRELEDGGRVRLLLGKGYEMVVCVPLIVLDKVVGVMNLSASRVIELDPHKIDLLMIIGNQIATAANNARLYEEIQGKVKELQEKKETIKFFAYSASHDLKCPAVGLHGLAKRLQAEYAATLDAKGGELCEQILRTSSRILALSEKINAYIVTKESPLKIEKNRLEEITDLIRSEFEPVLRERNIRWFEPSLPVVVEADRSALLRFFQNCVDNALKYGGEGLTEIRIGYMEDQDSHILSVHDDGVGLSQEDAEGIFELFRRHETSKGVDGSGLGLAIVRELARRHGGRVWAETGEGRGITFFLSLPKSISSSWERTEGTGSTGPRSAV